MPRYDFHVRRGQITILDHEGVVLADAANAKGEAERRPQHVNGASMDEASPSRSRAIIVADDNWNALFEFPF